MKLVDIIKQKKLFLNEGAMFGTDKENPHKYCSLFYDSEFLKYKNQKISLFEIGVYHGGSLILWDEYFSDCKILGVDIKERKVLQNIEDCKNVTFKIADAYQKDFSDTLDSFDILIDDGPHTLESQCKFLELYCDKIKKGGVLIIEDILKYEYTEKFKQYVPDNLMYEIKDLRSNSSKKDNILFVVRN